MGRGHEEQNPEEAAQHGGHPGQEQPDGLDRSVQGRNSAGMERPGPQKEEEAVAAARNGKDNMNKSADAKEWSNRDGMGSARRSGASGGGEAASGEKAWKLDGNVRGRGVQRSRTGRKIRGRSGPGLERPGLQKEEAAAARYGKESMNRSDEGWRGDMRCKSCQEGGEGTDRQGKKANEGGGAKDWKTGAQLGLRGRNARRHTAD